MITLTPSSTSIAPGEDFTFEWDDPADAAYHWTRDVEHIPQPITPMFSSFAALTAGEGRGRTVEVYGESILSRRDIQIHGYNFTRIIPFTGTPEEMESRIGFNRERVGGVAANLRQHWEKDWLPELKSHWRFWEDFDLAAATDRELASHLDETIRRAARIYEIHYLMGPPMWWALDEFAVFYCDLFPGSTALDAHALLQGFDNKTLEIGRALWQLSRLAGEHAHVRDALLAQPVSAILSELERTPEGRSFLSALLDFQHAYGRRSDLWDWGYPSWQENPIPILNNVKNYLSAPQRDMLADLQSAAAAREAAVADARARLIAYPRPVQSRFETLLSAAQTALTLSEDHTYWIDFNGFGWVRCVILECGRRLARLGCLAMPGDVFYLTIAELRAQMSEPVPDCAGLAASRRAGIEYWTSRPAPLELGTRPAAPLRLYSPDGLRMARYLGCFVADEFPQAVEPGLLRGQPGSAGKVVGRARVILSLDEANRLQPGEILVTSTTAPPWTPLFLTAAGLVTDAGGLLSHGAVVSREYRIPAVVGTYHATRVIADGQLIEVDGQAGQVKLL